MNTIVCFGYTASSIVWVINCLGFKSAHAGLTFIIFLKYHRGCIHVEQFDRKIAIGKEAGRINLQGIFP